MAARSNFSLPPDTPLKAMDVALDGIAILDRAGAYRYMNEAHALLYGYDSPDELIGKTWRVLYGPAARRDFETRYLPELAARGKWRGEVEGERRDGGCVYVEVSLTVLGDGALICVCRDVGERRRAAESLELYGHMVSSINTLMAFVDDGHRLRVVNRAFVELYGTTVEDTVGRRVAELVGEEPFAALIEPEMDRCLGGERVHARRWMRLAEGEARYIDMDLDPYRDRDGTVRGVVWSLRDVTEAKRTEDALRRSEQQLEAIFEHSPCEIYLKDPEGRYVKVSRRTKELFGLTDENARGRLPHEVHEPGVAETSRAHDLAVLETGRAMAREQSMRTDDGAHTLLTVKFPIRDDDGTIEGLGAITLDITDRIRAEEAVRESESRFRNLVEGSVQGVIIHRDDVPLYVNQAAADIFGYPSPRALMALGMLYPLEAPYEHERLRGYSAARRAGQAAPAQYEFDGRREDGSVVNLINSARVVAWHGEPAIQSTLIDITQKKRVEAALRNSRETLRAVIDAVPAMINAKDARHRVIFMNEYQAKVYGVSVKSAVGKTVRELVDLEHGAYTEALERRVLDSGKPLPSFEEPFVDRDGAEHTLLTTIVPIAAGDEPWVVTIALDITPLKRAAEERERLIAELEARNAELERFGYTVSHDLKSPLITIRGFAGHLERDLAAGDAERSAADLAQIEAAAERMEALLKDMLDLSRLGRVISVLERVALADIVRDALLVLEGPIARSGARIEIAPQLPVFNGDRARLAQVVQNLIDNALKFRAAGTAPIVEVGVRENGTRPVCYVRDNGRGIDPEHHDTVFGLFERLGDDVDGTGIGLAMVRRIIEIHGGRVWVESDGEGRGTTVCFTLPTAAAGEGVPP